MTIHKNKNVSYNGITVDQFHAAVGILSRRMFDLFDNTGRTYAGNRGGSLMWSLSFTAQVMSSKIAQTYKHDRPLHDHILAVLIDNAPDNGWARHDLKLLQ
jgi:hypothetical protein